jgi:hypothetical protein
MKFSCQLRLTPEEKAPELNGRRVDPRVGLGVLGKTNTSTLFRESKPHSRRRQVRCLITKQSKLSLLRQIPNNFINEIYTYNINTKASDCTNHIVLQTLFTGNVLKLQVESLTRICYILHEEVPPSLSLSLSLRSHVLFIIWIRKFRSVVGRGWWETGCMDLRNAIFKRKEERRMTGVGLKCYIIRTFVQDYLLNISSEILIYPYYFQFNPISEITFSRAKIKN